MELNITVESDSAVKDSALLRQFLAEQNLEGIDDLELGRAEHKAGQQGLGKFLGNLIIKLTGSENVIKQLIISISDFAAKYDRRIHLGNGVVIPTNKLTSEQIEKIVIELSKKDLSEKE